MVNRLACVVFNPLDKPIQSSRDTVNRKTRNRPCRDDPQRRAFSRVVMPEVGLCSPRFNCQTTADTYKDNQYIRFEVCPRHNGDGHEQENAQQQPIHIQPPRAVPINIGKYFFCKRPPDIKDEKDRYEKSAKQNG